MGRKISRFKRDVVLQVFTKYGPAWDAIRDMRSRWEVTARVGLPPISSIQYVWDFRCPYPDNWPEKYTAEGGRTREWAELAQRWRSDLDALRDRIVPEAFCYGPMDASWRGLLASCVLFDPPETELLRFAELGGPFPRSVSPVDEGLDDPGFGNPSHAMMSPPVVTLRDGLMAEFIERWYWREIIAEIGKRYLEPQGLDTQGILKEVLLDSRELHQKRAKLQEQENPHRHYIAVYKDTTGADVRCAFRLISDTLPERSDAGAPRRDPLVALQCAILYDFHNQRSPIDGRAKRWTYEKLAEEFRLKSARAAKQHVAEGRRIREQQNGVR